MTRFSDRHRQTMLGESRLFSGLLTSTSQPTRSPRAKTSPLACLHTYLFDLYRPFPKGFLPLTPTAALPTLRCSSPQLSNQRNTCSYVCLD